MAGTSSIVKQAENVRRAGRKGDSVLAHINPRAGSAPTIATSIVSGSGSVALLGYAPTVTIA